MTEKTKNSDTDGEVGYKKRMKELQKMLAATAGAVAESKRAMIVVAEGLDASGKSGCIRRLTRELDTKQYRVVPIAKPSEEEYRYHYLHRFWKTLPEYGKIVFYDRSWYGRVLVERIEGFAKPTEWQRAYGEINSFEHLLTDDGAIIIKLWFEVSAEEQLRRFKDRMSDPAKQHKLTNEDWRNRSKREQYDKARDDMLALTNKANAPWFVIPADRKKEARIRAAETVISFAETVL